MGCLDFVVNIDNNDLHSFNCNAVEILSSVQTLSYDVGNMS